MVELVPRRSPGTDRRSWPPSPRTAHAQIG